MQKILPLSRWLVLFATLILPVAFFQPVWQIQLWAPQYPEGLEMKVWIDHLTGNVDIINQLNHYIGMEHISEDMFPEFRIMKYLLGGMILLGLVTFVVNREWLLKIFCTILIIAALAALVDLYLWGYKYGHNLDPEAPIKIEGQSYQPPLIGYKVLLNFTALSMPDKGGWALFGSGAITFAGLIIHLYKRRKKGKIIEGGSDKMAAAASISALLLLSSCSSEPEAIRFGSDACAHCSMTIIDPRFGAELITNKGKVFKFDDIGCLFNYQKEKQLSPGEKILVVDFVSNGKLVEGENATFLKSDNIRSPMNSNVAAFASPDSSVKYSSSFPGESLSLEELKQQYK